MSAIPQVRIWVGAESNRARPDVRKRSTFQCIDTFAITFEGFHTYERRILTLEETSRVLTRLDDPNLLIIETCIATGARISEVLGPKWKHVNYNTSTIRIEQRLWRQELSRSR